MSLCHQTEKAAAGDVSYMALFDLLTSLSSVASVRGAKFSPLAAERSGRVAQGGYRPYGRRQWNARNRRRPVIADRDGAAGREEREGAHADHSLLPRHFETDSLRLA